MSTENAVLTIIHDQLGQVLTGVFARANSSNPFTIAVNADDGLLKQLNQDGDDPPRISLGFGLDVLNTSVSAVLGALPVSGPTPFGLLDLSNVSQVLDKVRSALGGRLGLFERQRDAIAKLIAARDPASRAKAVGEVFRQLSADLAGSSVLDSVGRLQQFIGNDLGPALTLTTMVGAVQQGQQNIVGIPESVERALLAYFFRSDGFKTVDGESVVSPVHLSDVQSALAAGTSGGVQSLKGLFSKTNAERYIRDTIRVTVESAFDTARGFNDVAGTPGVYGAVVTKLKNPTKFVTWFRGFSSMSESVAMRAVEVGTQGVSEFQTNPLIAAAAGSFAGTVARKLAQDSFLSLLRKDLSL